MGLFTWLSNRLPSRQIMWEDTGEPPVESPQRKIVKVKTQMRKMKPLAQVRKGWGTTIILRFSRYISGNYISQIKKDQALQTCLHELMHIALWDDRDRIQHSTDPASLVYSMIDGNTKTPTAWDLGIMIEAANRIDTIEINTEAIELTLILFELEIAVKKWNSWIGKELFVLL